MAVSMWQHPSAVASSTTRPVWKQSFISSRCSSLQQHAIVAVLQSPDNQGVVLPTATQPPQQLGLNKTKLEAVVRPPRIVTARLILRLISIVCTTIAGFTLLLHKVEKFSLGDAFYFTITTATSVGYGDLYPTRRLGKGLVALLGCVGVALLGTLAAAALDRWAEEHADRAAPSLLSTLREGFGLLLVGVVGLRKFERLDWVDSAYCAVITLTTAGLGDVAPMTRIGRLFITACARARHAEKEKIMLLTRC